MLIIAGLIAAFVIVTVVVITTVEQDKRKAEAEEAVYQAELKKYEHEIVTSTTRTSVLHKLEDTAQRTTIRDL